VHVSSGRCLCGLPTSLHPRANKCAVWLQETTFTKRTSACEKALYALLAANHRFLLESPVITSWHDALWAVTSCACDARLSKALWQHRQAQRAVTSRLPAFVMRGSQLGNGASYVERVTTVANLTATGALKCVVEHFVEDTERHKAVMRGSRAPFSRVQAALIEAAGSDPGSPVKAKDVAAVLELLHRLTKAGGSNTKSIVPASASRMVEESAARQERGSAAVVGTLALQDATLLRFAAHFVLFARACLDDMLGEDGDLDDVPNPFGGAIKVDNSHRHIGDDILHLYCLHLMRHMQVCMVRCRSSVLVYFACLEWFPFGFTTTPLILNRLLFV